MTDRPKLVGVDTGVFTAALRPGSGLQQRYHRHLVGRTLVVSVQVVVEARYGALRADWASDGSTSSNDSYTERGGRSD